MRARASRRFISKFAHNAARADHPSRGEHERWRGREMGSSEPMRALQLEAAPACSAFSVTQQRESARNGPTNRPASQPAHPAGREHPSLSSQLSPAPGARVFARNDLSSVQEAGVGRDQNTHWAACHIIGPSAGAQRASGGHLSGMARWPPLASGVRLLSDKHHYIRMHHLLGPRHASSSDLTTGTAMATPTTTWTTGKLVQ